MARKRKPKQRRRPPRTEEPRSPSRALLESRRVWLIGIILVTLIAGAVYANSLHGDFVWDDRMLILKDPAVQSLSNVDRFFTEDFFVRQENELGYGYYRPIVKTSYALDHALWGRNPFGYHLTNVFLHACCTMLVVLLLGQLGLPRGTSLVAGLIFAVHPIHTENVAWIAGRTDLLAFLFTGLSLMLYLAATQARSSGGTDRRVSEMTWRAVVFVLSVVCFAFAMLAKEMSIVLVPWIVCVELFVRRKGLVSSALAATPHGLVVVGYLLVRMLVIRVPMPGQPDVHSIAGAAVSAGQLVARYLGWMTGVREFNAYVQNPYVTDIADPRFLGAAAVLAALAYIVWRSGRNDGLVLALAGMLATSFIPILNIVRAAGPPDMGNMMAERFCYFPSLPFVALVVLIGARLMTSRSRRSKIIGWAALAVWLGVAVTATVKRNLDWYDNRTFFTRTLEQTPDAALLWTNLANHHLESGDVAAAQKALTRATALAPTNAAVMTAQATMYVVTGRPADAVPIQERVVRRASRSRPVVLANLAYLYRLTGKQEEALEILERLLADGKRYPSMYFNLAEIYDDQGEIHRARMYYRKAIDGDPDNLQMMVAFAKFEASGGRLESAEALYREALTGHPDDSRILNNIATLRHRQGDVDGALTLLARAIEIEPTTVNRINYARLLASSGRGAEAIAQLETAARTAPDAEKRSLAEKELAMTRRRLDRPTEP